jgi:hypothetical protein
MAMIMGFIDIDPRARVIHTHRDSYLLNTVTVVSVRRPLLAAGVVIAAGIGGFGAIFHDLLFPAEIAVAMATSITAFGVGICIGQLQLLSRDLRGSELSGAVWGSFGALNQKRMAIARAISAPKTFAMPDGINTESEVAS